MAPKFSALGRFFTVAIGDANPYDSDETYGSKYNVKLYVLKETTSG